MECKDFCFINLSQRTVSCGPSYGSRACFPDPLDLWVSTYQKLRLEDEIEEEKVHHVRIYRLPVYSNFSYLM